MFVVDAPAKVSYFTGCRCPACKHRLDGVATTIANCPQCNTPLEKTAVWATRRYEGQMILPGWLSAFGWPMLVILGGVLIGAVEWFVFGILHMKLIAAILAVGIVWFFIKFMTADD